MRWYRNAVGLDGGAPDTSQRGRLLEQRRRRGRHPGAARWMTSPAIDECRSPPISAARELRDGRVAVMIGDSAPDVRAAWDPRRRFQHTTSPRPPRWRSSPAVASRFDAA